MQDKLRDADFSKFRSLNKKELEKVGFDILLDNYRAITVLQTDHMLGKEIPELMKMLVKEKREESLDLKGMGASKTAKESFVSNF